ncbi:uncharacterized protein LOC123536104 [Mercenaria mercenaria]|uniref:uncharacterized protein LOC123536104 n=1 Tax=Mercenaria mercenaria TaxID=6596 RepID=UPI00234F3A48|nr:uncharacterized protein LOC123536104 [Mercenaria mercenaria]
MGVTQLWQILAPVEQHLTLSSLAGQTLAVDLSIWVCENQCVKQMQGVVSKPYLRNLFFRISHLTQLGVKLVFVIEGSAPELKWDTMIKRQQSRFPGRQGKQPPQRPAGKQTRRNFNSWLKECCELLEILGIPYIQSKGEAEALCALLNASGLVDGCLTNDGDAFLYGATTVYRNFTMNSKDPHVDMYRVNDIQTKLGIDRGGLIALGLLIGCDFVPKGVPGIGIANAVRLLQSLQGQDVLIRLQSWSTMSERDCVDQAEILARRKAIQLPDFPQIKVIDEFLVAKDRCPSRLPEWKRPVPAKLQEFALIKLEWPVEYTMEKVLPLITLWDMQDLSHSKNPSVHQHLKPHRIVKTRIRQGEPCYEVEWIKPVTDTVYDGSFYITIEAQDLFSKCYPDVVKAFITQSAETKKKPKAKKKKKKAEAPPIEPPSLDNLSFQFEKVNLGKVASQLQESVKDLHPSFSEYDETALTTKAKQPRHLTLSPNSKKSGTKGENSEIRKPVAIPISQPEETVTKSGRGTEESSVVPLSQRVKLRLQNKHHGNNKENQDKKDKMSKMVLNDQKFNVLKSPGADLSSMGSLLEDIQNLSLKEAENFRHKSKEKTTSPSLSKLRCESSRHVVSMKQTTSMNVSTRKMSTMKEIQKMSSPLTEVICSPMTYMKHQGALGDSFEIQRSPYYIENPFAAAKLKTEKTIDISSPGFFSRPDPKTAPEEIDKRCAAERLIEKIESGISQVGTDDRVSTNHVMSSQKKTVPKSVPGGEELTVDSLMSILNNSSSGKLSGTPQQLGKEKISSQANQTTANQSVLGLETSLGQFGDFQIQHSLLNSLCSSLVQALTPKGVSMTRDEYDKLLNTLNEIDSDEDDNLDENSMNENNVLQDEVVCNIDFSELEKASTSFKNLNQKLLLRPIQIDDEDVMSKLSKSARKKLRRRERKREQELENLAQLQNMSHCKGKTKSSGSGQQTHRDSVKTNCSEKIVNDGFKKTDKRKKVNENSVHNLLHTTKSAGKANSKMRCSTKTNVSKTENSPCANTVESKLSRPEEMKENNDQSEVIVESDPKLKKKRKKKKVKKASSVIDISADNSILEVGSCAEYLKKALENNQKKLSENRITKASPFMDVSADDTLLELEGLSCKVTGEELDSDLETKLKKKKRISKEKMCKEYGANMAKAIQIEPVLSINNMVTDELGDVKSENSHVCECGEKGKAESEENKVTVKAIEVDEVVEIKLEEDRNEEFLVEKICSDALNMQSTEESALSNAKTREILNEDARVIKLQENNSAANFPVRELEHSEKARESSNCDSDMKKVSETKHESGKTVHGLVDTAFDIDKADTSDEGLKNEKDNAEINCVCNTIENDSSICLDNEKNLVPEVVCSAKDKDEESENGEVAKVLETLNTYHMEPSDRDVEVLDKNTSHVFEKDVLDKISLDTLVLNVEDDASDTVRSGEDDANGIVKSDEDCEKIFSGMVDNTESRREKVENGKTVCEFSGQSLKIGVENISKKMLDTVRSNASDNDSYMLDVTNGVDTCTDNIVEENGEYITKFQSIVNGKVRVDNLDSSEENMEKCSLNGNGYLENSNENGTEICKSEKTNVDEAWRDNVMKPEVFQSPACLADRLKLKLRKTSTKNVLDAFTNGK